MEYNDITETGYNNWNDLQELNDEYQGIQNYLDTNPPVRKKSGITQKQRQELIDRQLQIQEDLLLLKYGIQPYQKPEHVGRYNPQYVNFEDQPYMSPMANTDTPFGESRYDDNVLSMYLLENLQDVRANNQSGFNKLMAGTAKAAVLAGTTWLDGTVGLVYGLGAAIGGTASDLANGTFEWNGSNAAKLFDNELSNGFQDVNQYVEKIMPNYRSDAEQSRQWYQNMGTANFWADFLKQIGFTVGAYYSGAAWTKALKAVKLLKSPIGARVAGSLLSGINEGRIEANQIQDEHYNRETELLDIAFNKEKDDVMRRYYNGQLSDIEANAILESLYSNNDINKQKIKENSDLVGLIDLGINVPILTLDNMLMFGKAYSRGFNNANKAVNSRRTVGLWFRDLQGKASENLGALENEVAQNVEKTAAGYGWNTITKGLAALKGMGHFLREGNEEMMQAYASELASALYQPDSPDAYYQALYDPNALDNTKSFYQSAILGFSNSYGNLDRWQEFVMGGLTGLLGTVTFGKSLNQSPDTYVGKGKRVGVTGGLLGELAAANYYNQRGEANVKFMNDYVQSRQKDFENKIRHFAMSDHYNSLMNGWAEESNKFEYENAKDNDDFEAFTRFNNAGRLQDFKDMIDQDFTDLSDEDLDLIAKSQDNNNQWKNPDGTYMSETPEGRAKMREKLELNRQDLIKGLEYFEDAYESIVNATNDNLTNDQNLELAWLKWKVNKFNDRFENITSENKPFFKSFKEGLQEYVNAFDDSVDESKLSDDVKENDPTKLSDRLKYEFSKRIVNNARELIKLVDYLDNSSDALDFQRKAGVNYKTLNQIIDEDTYDLFAGYTSMTYDQYHDTIQNLLDAAKLGIAANEFDERLQEYMNDPANIEKHHSKVRQKVDKAVDNVKSNRAAQEFNNKDVSEVANMIEGLELMETDDGDLVNSSNVNITKNMSKEEKDQAKQKFDEASKLKKTKDMVIAEIERDQDIALQLDITPSDKQAAIQSLQMSFESGDMEVFMPDQTVELDVIMPQDGNDAQLLELLNDKRNVYINTMLGVVHKRKQDAEKREEHTPDIDTEKESQNQDLKQENTTGNDSVDKTPPVLDNENNNTPQTEEQVSTPEIDDSEINSQNESQKKSDDEQLNVSLSENQWKPGLSRYPLSRFRNSHQNINPQTPYYKLVKDNPSQYGYNEDSVEYKYIVNVGEYLDLVGAFENRYKGTLRKDGEIHFMISPTLNSKVGETIVLILDKDNNVIGNLPYLNARGNSQELNDFIYDCIVKYQTLDNGDLGDYIITGKDSKPITSYIDQMYNGRIPIDYVKVVDLYVPQRHTISNIFGNSSDAIKFGITKESGENIPVYTKKSKYSDPNVRSAKRALKGQPFLLIKTASGQEVTVPIFMRRYSESTAVVDQESLIPTYFDREVRSLVNYVIENNNKKQFTTNIQQIANDAFNSLFSSQDFRIWFDPKTKTITQVTIGGNNPVRVESKKRTLYDATKDGVLTELMLISAIRNANMPINFDLNRINSVSQDDYIGGVKYNIAMALMAEATLPIGVIHTIDDFFTFSPIVDGSAIKAPVLRFESKYESTPNIKILDDGVSKIDYVTWDYISSSDEHEIVYDVNDDINAFIDNNDKDAQKRLLERANLFVEKRLQPENGLVVIFLKFNTTQRQLQYDINKKQLIIPQGQQIQLQPQIDMSASPVFDGPSVSIELMNDNAGLQVQLNPTQLPLNPETGVKSSYNDVDMQEVETWFEDESPVGIIDYYHEVWGDLDESDKKKIYAIRNDFPDIGLILDEFNTDNHSDTLDALINGGLYRRVEETAQSKEKVRDEEMEWFKQTYPQLSSQERLRIVDGLIEISNSDNPGYAWGKFSRGVIEISNVAASGTVYHEAFHAISHTLMTNNEFNRMLNVARKLHPEMTNLDLEEFMAEDFRGYMLIGISQHKDNFIQRIFKLLKNIIKGLFNKQYLLTNAYYRISQGLYSNRNIRQTNAVRDSKTSNSMTAEMQLIKQQAIADENIVLKEDGTFDYALAPNGNRSNLNERQWLQVRTKNFINWFGDWINNTANASKVVDENGEPLQVYHHTDNPNLTEFSTDFENYFSKDGGTKEAIFFDENETGTLGRKYNIPVFLNIRELNEYNETKQQLHDRGTTYREVVNQSAEKNNKDGGVHMKDFDDNRMEHLSIWIVHNPNQIKSATDNNGEFSTEDDNIYYRKAQPSLLEFTQSTIKSIHDLINKIGPIKVGVTEVVELLTPKRKFRNLRTGNYDFFENSRYFVNLATLFNAGYNPDSAFDTDGSENYYNRTQVINEIENRISKLGLNGLVYIGRNEYGAYELMSNEEALRNVYDSAYGYKTKEIVRVSANELFDASGLSTVSDILDKVISLDSRIGFLASELRRKINKNNNIEVRLVTPEELLPYSKNGRIPDGLFVPGPEHLRTSEILINKDTYRPDIIVLHEIVHMFAFNSRKNASKLKQLQRIYEDAILQLEDKYGKSKEDLISNGVEVTRKDGSKHTIKPFYGLTNIDEFLSEAFANPLFMNELATLEFGSDKKKNISLFDRFTNWVLGILGIDRTSDVFDRTVKFLNEMFTDQLDVSEENVYQYAQNYSLYQESYFASPLYEEDLVYDKHTKLEYDNLSDDRIEYLQKSNINRWVYDRLDDDSKEMLFDCAH